MRVQLKETIRFIQKPPHMVYHGKNVYYVSNLGYEYQYKATRKPCKGEYWTRPTGIKKTFEVMLATEDHAVRHRTILSRRPRSID